MPLPEPLAPEVTVSQLVALLVAVQLHIDGIEKLKDPVWPSFDKLTLAGLRAGTQDISSLVTSLPPAYTYSLSFVKGGSVVAGDAEDLTAAPVVEAAFTEARLGAGLMARQTLRDANATALDVNNKTIKRARLLCRSLEMAPELRQRFLKGRNLLPLILDLLNVLPFIAMPVLLTR